jgi:arginine-tRNA-protein transferase
VERLRFFTPRTDCELLPGRDRRMQYELASDLTAAEYQGRMLAGWRRFGPAMFRNACPSCQRCQSLRVPVASFRPDATQRRVWRANRSALQLVRGVPSMTAAKQRLFDAFHEFQHEARGWPMPHGEETSAFVHNPFPTDEWCYYLDDRLVGVGYVDVLPAGLSAIYFYYDPAERRRSLGTFNVLSAIEAARELGLEHVYLGYYVAGCRSLEYKARFRPNEILLAGGDQWTPFGE